MAKYQYAREKFSAAVRELTLGPGDIKARLISAYMRFHTLNSNDFPDELKVEYDWIIKQLLKKPALCAHIGDQVISGSAEQTLHFMRRSSCVRIAERILSLKLSLDQEIYR
jgi:hypothetical protein